MAAGSFQEWIDFCRAELARHVDREVFTRSCFVIGLAMVESPDEAIAAAEGLIEAAEATRNPHQIVFHSTHMGMPTATPIRSAR